jgi:membrane fusion protein (multidrug efflux system)
MVARTTDNPANMIKRLFLVLLLLAVIFGTVGWLKYQQIQQAEAARKPPPPAVVAVTRVRQEQWQPYLSAVGSLVAVAGISVSNQVAGVVSEIHFESGQEVRMGDLLLDLDAAADHAELEGLQAARRLAQLKFRRAAKLVPERSMSQADYDEAKATLDGADAAVNAKRALIDKKHILAPFDGVLGIREVDPGQYLPEGSAIVPLESLDPVHVDFALPERHLSVLRVGQAVRVTVQAWPGERFQGRITALNPGIDTATRTLRARATLDNPDRRLRPGMFAEVQVLLPAQGPVLTLPTTAIVYNPYGDAVFLVQEEGDGFKVRSRQVEAGQVRAGRVEVRKGLETGDRVVSAGQVKLRNGMAVTLDERPAPGERDGLP